jgi:hypothetical protein
MQRSIGEPGCSETPFPYADLTLGTVVRVERRAMDASVLLGSRRRVPRRNVVRVVFAVGDVLALVRRVAEPLRHRVAVPVVGDVAGLRSVDAWPVSPQGWENVKGANGPRRPGLRLSLPCRPPLSRGGRPPTREWPTRASSTLPCASAAQAALPRRSSRLCRCRSSLMTCACTWQTRDSEMFRTAPISFIVMPSK